MLNIALLVNNKVHNVIFCDSVELAQSLFPTYQTVLVDESQLLPHIGLGYSEETGFEQPAHHTSDDTPPPFPTKEDGSPRAGYWELIDGNWTKIND